MTSTRFLSRCPGLLLLALAVTAQAQTLVAPDFPAVAVGGEVQGVIEPQSAHRLMGAPFVVYRVELEAGRRYAATVRTTDFAPGLSLLRPVGGLTEHLRDGMYAGEDAPSRMRIRVDDAGTYLLVVTSHDQGTSGNFVLTVEALADPVPATPRDIRVGQSVEGRLDDSSPIREGDWDREVAHDVYRLEAEAGQLLMISMKSEDFDSYLEFGHLADGRVDVFAHDDDGGEGLNALLRVTIPEDGTYGIIARSFGEEQYGRYSVSVTEREQAVVHRQPIVRGEVQRGSLTVEDAELDDRGFYQEWTFPGSRGETVSVRMRSSDFDTYLILGRQADGRFTSLAENDDAPGDGTNSLIVYTLDADGEYVLRATSLWGNLTGEYTIEIEPE